MSTRRARTGAASAAGDRPDTIRVAVARVAGEGQRGVQAAHRDAGLDLLAAESVTLPPGGRLAVRTGIAVAIPAGFAGFVLPRSGLARRSGLTILNAPGLIDAGYRGELQVLLVNHGAVDVTVQRGDRIAQLVVQRVERAELVEVEELPESERGPGGFGSTGA